MFFIFLSFNSAMPSIIKPSVWVILGLQSVIEGGQSGPIAKKKSIHWGLNERGCTFTAQVQVG